MKRRVHLQSAPQRAAAYAFAAGALAGCDRASLPDTAPPDASAEGSTEGDAGYALRFNGSSDYALTGTGAFPSGAATQSVSLWARPSRLNGTQVLVVLRRDEASGLELGIRGGSFSAWTLYGDVTLVQDPAAPDGGWHHVEYVFTAVDAATGVATLYVDGVATANGKVAPNKLLPLSSWIGSLDGLTDYYAGDLDEVRIWTVPRSLAEVKEEMQGSVSHTAEGLVAYFSFDSIRDGVVPDESGNGNDALLGGGNKSATPLQVPSPVPRAPTTRAVGD